MSSPFTPEHIGEWASFGPNPKVKPTPSQQVLGQEHKQKYSEMNARLAKEKIEKEHDRLVEESDKTREQRPEYLDGQSGTRDFYPLEMESKGALFVDL